MANLTQEQLDEIIRQAKGNNAVEAMVHEDGLCQLYRLSDGTFLEVAKSDGLTWIATKAEVIRFAKAAGNKILAAKIKKGS